MALISVCHPILLIEGQYFNLCVGDNTDKDEKEDFLQQGIIDGAVDGRVSRRKVGE